MRISQIKRKAAFSSPFSIRAPGFPLPYLYSLGVIALITGGGWAVRNLISPTNLVMPYLLGVVTIAIVWGRGPAVFASVLGVLAFDVFLVPPYLTFGVEDTEYIITFLALFIVGVIISNLASQIKDQMLAARDREERVTLLYRLSHDLAIAYSLDDVLEAIADNLRSTLGRDFRIFLKSPGSSGQADLLFDVYPPESEQAQAAGDAVFYTFRTSSPSGFGTEMHADSREIHFPLVTNSGTLGVISITGINAGQSELEDHVQIYEAFANLSALAIERVYLNEQASQTQLLKAKDELQTTLLNSVSHDFRTPLVTITGTLSSLDTEIHLLDGHTQRNLVRYALKEAEKLNRLVGNLLDMSRLESGALQLQLEPIDMQDLIGATLESMKVRIDCEIRIDVPDHLPLVLADFVLVQQALANLLDNALKYSPEGAPIDIDVRMEDGWVCISVADRGRGIDDGEIPHIFNKFYRIKGSDRPGGTGLGLAIVKGIADAHSARLEVSRRDGGGMLFRIGFPQFEWVQEAMDGC